MGAWRTSRRWRATRVAAAAPRAQQRVPPRADGLKGLPQPAPAPEGRSGEGTASQSGGGGAG
eukprot:2047163-Prymnesium_polylepis.1